MKLRLLLPLAVLLVLLAGCGMFNTPSSRVALSLPATVTFDVEVTTEKDEFGIPHVTNVLIATEEFPVSFSNAPGAPEALITHYSVELFDNDGEPLGGDGGRLSSDAVAVRIPAGYACSQGGTEEDPQACDPELRFGTRQESEPLTLSPITLAGAVSMLNAELNTARLSFTFTVDDGTPYDVSGETNIHYLGDCFTSDCFLTF